MESNEKDIDGTVLLKYLNETANPEEQKQVDQWLAEDVANNDALTQLALIFHAQRTQQRIRQRDPQEALHKVHQRMKQTVRRIFLRRLAVAASILFGIFGIGAMLWQNRQANLPPQMITVSTNAGMRSELNLPDGTSVFLNANSTLEYNSNFDKNKRNVRLSGEAYFKVAHDKDRPFIVNTANGKIDVKVLGTEFNLQAYEKEEIVQLVLVKGNLQLGIQGKTGYIQLYPEDRVTYNILTDQIIQEKINTAQLTAWVDGRLVFRDTPVPEVLRQLTHFYSVDFDVQDKVIEEYSFTGTFENRPLFQILDYMKISSKIDYMMIYPENQEVRKPVIRLKK